MAELVCELIISLDGFARSQRSPGYYGYSGPEFDDWIKAKGSSHPLEPLIRRILKQCGRDCFNLSLTEKH